MLCFVDSNPVSTFSETSTMLPPGSSLIPGLGSSLSTAVTGIFNLANTCLQEDLRRRSALLLEGIRADRQRELGLELEGLRASAQVLQAKLNLVNQKDQQAFQAAQAALSREHTLELQRFSQEFERYKSQEQSALQRWLFEQQRQLQWELEQARQGLQLELAERQRHAALQGIEVGRALDRWPINTLPSQIMALYGKSDTTKVPPLLLLLAPTRYIARPGTQPKNADHQHIESNLKQIVDLYNERGRRVRFLDGAWRGTDHWGEAAVANLFWGLGSIPVLVLESVVQAQQIEVRAYLWSAGQQDYGSSSISIALAGEGREGAGEQGRLEEALSAILRLVVAWTADAFHLIHHQSSPGLPRLLPTLLGTHQDREVRTSLLRAYRELTRLLEPERSSQAPDVVMDIAYALAMGGEQTLAREQVQDAIMRWLRVRYLEPPIGSNALEELVRRLEPGDIKFASKLYDCLSTIGDDQGAELIRRRLRELEKDRNSQLRGHDLDV